MGSNHCYFSGELLDGCHRCLHKLLGVENVPAESSSKLSIYGMPNKSIVHHYMNGALLVVQHLDFI